MHVAYRFPSRLGLPGLGATNSHQVKGLVYVGVQVSVFLWSCEGEVPGVYNIAETLTKRSVDFVE